VQQVRAATRRAVAEPAAPRGGPPERVGLRREGAAEREEPERAELEAAQVAKVERREQPEWAVLRPELEVRRAGLDPRSMLEAQEGTMELRALPRGPADRPAMRQAMRHPA
jgi:hypothetical protein